MNFIHNAVEHRSEKLGADGGERSILDEETLSGAPSFGRDETPDWGNREWGTRVHDYYRVPPSWGP